MISITYNTNRVDPKFEWFYESLMRQMSTDDLLQNEILTVEFAPSGGFLGNEMEGTPLHRVIPPKPSLYQGDKRRTKSQCFSQSSVRNTGAIKSGGDYLVFVDDVSILMPGWWNAVKKASEKRIIVGGAYQKHFEMVVDGGKLISSRPGGIDCRWDLGNDTGPVKVTGGQLYGCSVGIPRDKFEAINGYDEICDSIGYEDCNFGIRLELAGFPIYYDRRMLTIESEELHNQPYHMKREDRVLEPEAYMAKLATFGPKKRTTEGKFDSSHMLLDIVYGTRQAWSFGNNYTISDERKNGTLPKVPDVDRHWFDDKLLSEI